MFDLDDTLINDTLGTQLAFTEAWDSIESLRGIPSSDATQVVRDIASSLWQESRYYDSLFSLGISSTEALYSDFAFETKFNSLAELSVWSAAFQEQVWGDSLNRLNISSEEILKRLSDSYKKLRIECVSVLSDTRGTLKELRSSYKLGLITNGPADLQSAKISAAGLERFFDSIVISGKEGIGKPDSGIFERALDALGVSPDTAVMVGDSYSRDIIGARDSGIRAIQLCHPETGKNPNTGDSQVIYSLGDLLTLY